MDSVIETRNLCRGFQVGDSTLWAVNNVSLSIPKNKLTVLRGRSGSGKTTLMNMLGALDTPTSGSILFEGTDITSISDAARDRLRRERMGFVFQSVALVSVMTALENVEFGLRIAGCPASERTARAEECLARVGLGKRIQHMPQQLSGGEQQRVAVARAIAHNPAVLFADEPTAEQDSTTGLQLIRLFKELSEHTTIIIATHDEGFASVADCVYELEDGVLK